MVDDAAPAAFICEEANMEGALKKKLWKTISYLLFLDYAAEEDWEDLALVNTSGERAGGSGGGPVT